MTKTSILILLIHIVYLLRHNADAQAIATPVACQFNQTVQTTLSKGVHNQLSCLCPGNPQTAIATVSLRNERCIRSCLQPSVNQVCDDRELNALATQCCLNCGISNLASCVVQPTTSPTPSASPCPPKVYNKTGPHNFLETGLQCCTGLIAKIAAPHSMEACMLSQMMKVNFNYRNDKCTSLFLSAQGLSAVKNVCGRCKGAVKRKRGGRPGITYDYCEPKSTPRPRRKYYRDLGYKFNSQVLVNNLKRILRKYRELRPFKETIKEVSVVEPIQTIKDFNATTSGNFTTLEDILSPNVSRFSLVDDLSALSEISTRNWQERCRNTDCGTKVKVWSEIDLRQELIGKAFHKLSQKDDFDDVYQTDKSKVGIREEIHEKLYFVFVPYNDDLHENMP